LEDGSNELKWKTKLEFARNGEWTEGVGSKERKEGSRTWKWEEEPEAKYIRIS
jgi:hypothetical protein